MVRTGGVRTGTRTAFVGSSGSRFGFGYGYPYYYSYGYPYSYGYYPYNYYGYYPNDYNYSYGYSTYNRPAYGGYSASIVVQVQTRLARAGYYRGPIDGVIG